MKRRRAGTHAGILAAVTAICVVSGFPEHGVAELVSISEHPVSLPSVPDALQLETHVSTGLDLPWFYEFSEESPPPVEAFTEELANCFSFYPAPLAHWVAAGTVEIAAVDLDGDETWRRWMDKIGETFLPYTLRRTEPFVEVGWGKPEDVEKVLEGLPESVPPLVLLARNPGQFLTMWHHVSGIDFLYDTELTPNFVGRRQPPEGFPEELTGLISTDRKPLEEYMSLLAFQVGGSAWKEEGNWVIGPFRRDKRSVAMLKETLAQIKENPYDHGFGDVEMALSRIGPAALPELIEEYKTADDYYFNSLTAILARINAPERDQLFLKELKEYQSKRDRFLEHWYVPTMVEALAGNNCRDSIPVIRELADDPMHEAACKVALNVLGVPMDASNPADLVVFSDQAKTVLDEEEVKRALPVLFAALDQCFRLAGRPASATGITLEGGPVRFEGPLPEEGHWWIVVGRPEAGEVPVQAGWWTGPLSAKGYEGKAAFKDGRWLFMQWGMTWIS